MKASKVFFEDMAEGAAAPEFKFGPMTRTDFVKYAGASGDFSPMHHDELYAIRLGNDRIFAHGLLGAGYLSHFISDWLGAGNLKKFSVRFGERVWPGDMLTCKGKITKCYVDGGNNLVEAEAWIENQNAQKTHISTLVAALPSRT